MKVFLFVAIVCFLLLGFLGQALAATPQGVVLSKKGRLTHLRVVKARVKKRPYRVNEVEIARMSDASFERAAHE